jgi:DNA polymerase III subunit delta
MAVLREAELSSFLKRQAAQANGLLIYGNDAAAAAVALRQVVAALGVGDQVERMDAASLKADPARLDDAFRAMSLLGDRQLIIVQDVDDAHLAALAGVVEAGSLGNFVVLLAGSLKKESKLRLAAERNPLFRAMALYAETGAAVVQRAEALLGAQGLGCDDGAADRLVELCGEDRSLLAAEAEKLALYCHPAKRVTVDDVEAICGDQARFEADRLIMAVLDGDMATTDRIYTSMALAGDGKSVLIMVQLYLSRLEAISAALARGQDLASACRAARPPIFDKQQAAAGRQLRAFSGDDLGRAQATVQAALLQSRQMAALGEAITGRCLMTLARMARQLRQQAA